LSEEVETLAREIAGPGANAAIQELARRVAEAQIDLRRVRSARHQFLSDTLSIQDYDSYANVRRKLRILSALLRPNPPDISTEAREFATSTSTPQGPDELATIYRERQKSYWPWIAMNGERCRDGNLQFEPSMRRADGALAIAIRDCTIANFGKRSQIG